MITATTATPATPATVQLTRLITNQLILGKTTTEYDTITIQDPYEVIPTAEGVQMIPFDEHILGVKLNLITIQTNNSIYTNEVSSDISNLYLTQLAGIITPNKELIL